ncbi:MaoC/PaaZ C-terminal domain-containing protein [Streptomyces sp. NPDC001984]
MSGDDALYFDDIEIGEVHRTSGRTITEGDINLFAGLSGDFNSLHVDDDHAARSPFGRRIAHGLLVLSVTSGLTTRLPAMYALQPALLGMLETTARFKAPVFAGDTIHVELEVTAKRVTSKGDRGVITEVRRTLNQRGEIVLESEWRVLVARRPGTGD